MHRDRRHLDYVGNKPGQPEQCLSVTASTVTDKRLDTPGIAVNSPSALVSFRSRFQLGNYGTLSPSHDGGVLEISSPNINGGMFTDVTDPVVGGYFLNGGYSESIANGFLSSIAGRQAWALRSSSVNLLSGPSSAAYVDVLADLGPHLLGQAFTLRFRLTSDNNDDNAGTWQIDNVLVKPSSCPPVLLSAVSRKIHGSVGAFEISLPLTGTPAIECRTGSPAGAHQIVLTFANSITFSEASVTAGTGNATASVSGPVVTLDLTGVTNAQTIALKLANADDGANHGDILVPITFLAGDTSGNGAVTSSDVAQTKTQVGQLITAANFRTDVDASGAITASDVALVKSESGTAISVSTLSVQDILRDKTRTAFNRRRLETRRRRSQARTAGGKEEVRISGLVVRRTTETHRIPESGGLFDGKPAKRACCFSIIATSRI